MKKIFNKIRRKMIAEGKFMNYLKYAFGEIILVVIGILIAIQINSWSELRKDRAAEQIYLQEMREDFRNNLLRSEDTIELINETVPELTEILKQAVLKEPTISLDSLNYNFSSILLMPTYKSTDRVYDNLIGSGDFKIISSIKLKNEIASYYKAVNLIDLVQKTHELELVNLIQPYIIQNMDYQSVGLFEFDNWDEPPSNGEKSILKVMKSREFRNIVMLKISILSDLLLQNKIIKKINGNMIKLLNKEIEKV